MNARILIVDNEQFRSKGRGVIYITENVNEVFEVADRVSVLEDGYRKSTEDVASLAHLKLLRWPSTSP